VDREPGGDVGDGQGRVPAGQAGNSSGDSSVHRSRPLVKASVWQLAVTDKEYAMTRTVSLLGIGVGLLIYVLTRDFQPAFFTTWVCVISVNCWALLAAVRRHRAQHRHNSGEDA